MKEFASLLPLLGIILVFWLLVIRPAGRRNREMARLQSALEVGDRVILGSGFYATVRSVDEDPIEVELADGVVVQVARGAIVRVIADDPAAEPDVTVNAEPASDTRPVIEEL